MKNINGRDSRAQTENKIICEILLVYSRLIVSVAHKCVLCSLVCLAFLHITKCIHIKKNYIARGRNILVQHSCVDCIMSVTFYTHINILLLLLNGADWLLLGWLSVCALLYTENQRFPSIYFSKHICCVSSLLLLPRYHFFLS